jgi:class 3 adenylate cyclase
LLGHRRKISRAIRELGATAPTKFQPPQVREETPQDAAERRQLTVMFCDLVGPTALSARLDPEDLGQIIGTYQRHCAEVIVRSKGSAAAAAGNN